MSLLENIYLVVSIILWHDSCPSNTNINHEYCSTLEHMNVDNSNKSHFAKPHTAGNGVFCCYIPLSLLVCLCNHYPNLCRKHLAIKKALEAAGLKPEEKLYDLGCGTGEVLVIGEKYFQASAMGFEYSLPLFILSKINIFASGLKKSAVRREDIFGPKVDLRDADVVFLFLTPKAFPKLKEKFEKELKPGARVVAYSSPLLFWEPCKIIEAPGASAKIYLYNNFELRNAR